MIHARAQWVLVVCVFMGVSGTLHAQARGPLPRAKRSDVELVEKPALVLGEAARDRMVAEAEAWLERLVGRFRVTARKTGRDPFAGRDITAEFTGPAECRRMGAGPGVRCVIAEPVLVRPPPARPGEAVADFGTASLLHFGINPDNLEIQVVVVHTGWVAARSGALSGDTVAFTTDTWKDCQRIYFKTCWNVAEITARPAAEVFMKIHADGRGAKTESGDKFDIELLLQRELPREASTP